VTIWYSSNPDTKEKPLEFEAHFHLEIGPFSRRFFLGVKESSRPYRCMFIAFQYCMIWTVEAWQPVITEFLKKCCYGYGSKPINSTKLRRDEHPSASISSILGWTPAGSMSFRDPHLPIGLPYTVIDLSCFQGSTKHETRGAGRISGGLDDLEVKKGCASNS